MTDDNIKYQTGFRRLGAAFVDTIVFIPLILLDTYIRNYFENKFIIMMWLFIFSVIGISYYVVMHFKYGQTIGKMAMKVKVIDLDETKNITLKQSVIRDSFSIIFQALGLLYFSIQIAKSILPAIHLLEKYDDFLALISSIWILLELLSMLTNDKKRAIHDFIAKTVVVRSDV